MLKRRSARRAPRVAGRATRLVHLTPVSAPARRRRPMLRRPRRSARSSDPRRPSREAHVPAQQPQAEEEARLPQPHAHPRRPGGPPQPASARPQAPQRLTWRIRDRATFEALGGHAFDPARTPLAALPRAARRHARACRVRRGARRRLAVRRNRIRRRLRAAVRQAEARGDLAPGSYLVGAGPEVVTMPFTDLERTLAELLATARDRPCR